MKSPLDRQSFAETIGKSETYEAAIDDGCYLGFYVPGDKVFLKKVSDLSDHTDAPPVVSRTVRSLFQCHKRKH